MFQSFAYCLFIKISFSVHLNVIKYCHLRATIVCKPVGIYPDVFGVTCKSKGSCLMDVKPTNLCLIICLVNKHLLLPVYFYGDQLLRNGISFTAGLANLQRCSVNSSSAPTISFLKRESLIKGSYGNQMFIDLKTAI